VVGNLYLGHIYYSQGDCGRAIDVLQRNIDLLAGEPTYERPGVSGLPYVMSCAWAANALADTGDFARARELAARGEAAGRKAGHASSLAGVEIGGANVATVQGDARQAIAALEPLLETCRAKHFAGWVMLAAWSLTSAYLVTGRPADALEICREG